MACTRVLHINHTAAVSGGERALLDLLAGIGDRAVSVVGSPEGPLPEAVRRLRLPVVQLPGTDGSLRLSLGHTSRAVADLLRSAWAIRRAARTWRADLVHANSIRAGIGAVLAERLLGGPPSVVHLHDSLPPGLVSGVVLQLISGARGLLANSEHTRHTLPQRAADRARVVYNPVDLSRFDPARADRNSARAELGLEPDRLTLTVVAQLTPWKGQEEAIRMLAALRATGRDATLLLVGSTKFVAEATRYDNRSYERRLHEVADQLDVGDNVLFAGEQEDIPAVLAASDLLLMPSWEEPFGRAMIEAMAMGVPVLATSAGGPAEVIQEGVTGHLLPPRNPGAWVPAIAALVDDPALRDRMGRAGRKLVTERFGVERYARDVLTAYDEWKVAA